MKPFLLALSLAFAALTIGISARESVADSAGFGKHDALVPHYLLGLVHAPEVHEELGLSPDQVSGLETLFAEIDAKWFPSRILAADQQRAIIWELEDRVRGWFAENTTPKQQERLNQLEYYAQGNRILLREDVGKRVGLASSQQQRIADLALATQTVEQKLAQTKYGDESIASLQSDFNKKSQEERAGITKIVSAEQGTKIRKLIGDPFDASKLGRIYAMAPEFASIEPWINSSPLSISDLRGKVVLVHFYAFQCHNCHANFEIYRRWHRELTDKGVVVVGIQTPETSLERDPTAIRLAAEEKGLDFPIAMDLKSETWAAWGNTMWPTVYVVDKHGYIRHWWSGELNWKGATADETIEKVVDQLLKES